MNIRMAVEKRVTYKASASYSTLHTHHKGTRNIWLVFHGMGHLSRYFARFFANLDPEANYIIAPQAPSKYYLGPEYKHVGASWLTREDTAEETRNVLAYVDAVWKAENISGAANLIILGYSQGVSIAARWISSRKIQCEHLILHSGGIPKELEPTHFDYMNAETAVLYMYGTMDEYIDQTRKTQEIEKATKLFGNRLSVEAFDGGHEVNIKFLQNILHF
jgi:predicted esterase